MTIVKVLLSLVVLFSAIATIATPASATTPCEPLPNESRSTHTVILTSKDSYSFWLRMLSPTAERNSVWVQLDGQCPVNFGDSQSNENLAWIGHQDGDQNKKVIFNLDAGEHKIIIAGREVGTGADKGLLTNDHSCTPVDNGDNCPNIAQMVEETVQEPPVHNGFNWLLIIALVTLAGTGSFLAWKYFRFRKKIVFKDHKPHPILEFLPVIIAKELAKLIHFFKHHKLIVFICSTLIIFSLIVGIVAANTGSEQHFETEAGALSGAAKVIDDTKASGGKYVLYGEVASTTSDQPTATNPTENPAASNPPDESAPPPTSGGGSTNPLSSGACPVFPAFPDENCTGWEHTGVTLTDCTEQTDDGYIWDDSPIKTFDSCYFSKTLTIEAANVTIKRSQIHGTVSTHWSHSYDFRGLTLEDVEIEQEGNSNANQAAIGGHNYTCLRCNIHHTGSGIHIGDNAIIRDSYTHDFNYTNGAHGAGIGAGQGNGNNTKLIHNNIQCNRLAGQPTICSSALSLYDEPTINNVLVENNLFNTSGSYCVYGGGSNGTNIRLINNRFGKKFNPDCAVYGPVAVFFSGNSGNVWSGNKWQDGSGSVEPSSDI